MTKAKIAISIRADILARVKDAVEEGAAPSVSSFFERAALAEIDADEAFHLVLEEILEATGGPLTDEERAEADAILDSGSRPA